MDEIQVGDRVSIQLQYNRWDLKLVGDEHRIVYRRRTRIGRVTQILYGNGRFPDTAIIALEASTYPNDWNDPVGMPLAHVTKVAEKKEKKQDGKK